MKIILNSFFKYFLFGFGLVILMVIILNFNFSKQAELISSNECRCKSEINDPNNIGLKLTSGRFKGMCLNSCQSRPILSDDLLNSVNLDHKTVRLKNIFHDKKFWSLELPIQELESVDVVFLNFTWKINHVSLKFHFNPKSRLILKSQSENLGVVNHQTQAQQTVELKQKSILISPDPSLPEDRKFSLVDGLIGSYSLIFKAYTAEEFFNNSARFDHKVKYLKTNLNAKESSDLLLATIARGSNTNYENYQLLFQNCATTTLDLILNSKNIDQKSRLNLWAILDPLRGVPSNLNIGTKRTLKSWDLIKF